MESTIGDYYKRKRTALQDARAALEAARGKVCPDCPGPAWLQHPLPKHCCTTCNGNGRIHTVSYDEMRQLERECERIADTGD